jgi:hypothetical protein
MKTVNVHAVSSDYSFITEYRISDFFYVTQMCTLEDHHKEIVRFCQRNGFQGLVADDAEYLVFDIQRYFSAQKLKLTFKV